MEKKELLKQANSKVQVQQAVAEKQIMAGLRHRNVVQVFALVSMSNCVVIVQPEL